MPYSVRRVDIDRTHRVIQRKQKVFRAAIGPEKSDLIQMGKGERGSGRGELWIKIDRAPKETPSAFIFNRLEFGEMPHPAVIALPSVEIVGRLPPGALALAALHGWQYRR